MERRPPALHVHPRRHSTAGSMPAWLVPSARLLEVALADCIVVTLGVGLDFKLGQIVF
jgi:hypothetical protein